MRKRWRWWTKQRRPSGGRSRLGTDLASVGAADEVRLNYTWTATVQITRLHICTHTHTRIHTHAHIPPRPYTHVCRDRYHAGPYSSTLLLLRSSVPDGQWRDKRVVTSTSSMAPVGLKLFHSTWTAACCLALLSLWRKQITRTTPCCCALWKYCPTHLQQGSGKRCSSSDAQIVKNSRRSAALLAFLGAHSYLHPLQQVGCSHYEFWLGPRPRTGRQPTAFFCDPTHNRPPCTKLQPNLRAVKCTWGFWKEALSNPKHCLCHTKCVKCICQISLAHCCALLLYYEYWSVCIII